MSAAAVASLGITPAQGEMNIAAQEQQAGDNGRQSGPPALGDP